MGGELLVKVGEGEKVTGGGENILGMADARRGGFLVNNRSCNSMDGSAMSSGLTTGSSLLVLPRAGQRRSSS